MLRVSFGILVCPVIAFHVMVELLHPRLKNKVFGHADNSSGLRICSFDETADRIGFEGIEEPFAADDSTGRRRMLWEHCFDEWVVRSKAVGYDSEDALHIRLLAEAYSEDHPNDRTSRCGEHKVFAIISVESNTEYTLATGRGRSQSLVLLLRMRDCRSCIVAIKTEMGIENGESLQDMPYHHQKGGRGYWIMIKFKRGQVGCGRG